MIFKMKEEVGFYTDLEYGQLHVAGDEEYGFRPYQLLVASIVVCSGGTLRKILEKKRLKVEDITIKTAVERNEAEANRVEKISIHYIIKGKELTDHKVQQSIEIAHKNCSMAQSVKGSIEINETFEIIEE
ncbi:OsmC family protein [Fredinandcohnia sp. 179-A 10B2 NHS]|uniref:OsmC family protein n=1 Tax=Fredinandcohnia sp. 179-A 10B2 NHS TaxID=3235176 RepID=UPI0039A0ADBE